MLISIISCSPNSRLADGEYLFNKSKIELDSKEINKNELLSYRKQSPNKTVLGFRFHLFLYNLANPEKTKGMSAWLRRIGEEPVVWNPVLSERTTNQFKRYLETKGYYENQVTDTVILDKGRAEVTHTILLNEPFRIKTIRYRFEDQKLKDFVLSDTSNCLFKVGGRFDKEVMQKERQRIETDLKNKGFFGFTKEHIYFEAKEIDNSKKVDLKIIIRENYNGIPDSETKVKHHYRYQINSTYTYPNYELFSNTGKDDKLSLDTVTLSKNQVIYSGRKYIKPEAILIPNRCTPGGLYTLEDVQKSYSNYSSFGLFRLINIRFSELDQGFIDTSEFRYLDCFIELSPRKPQSYQTEIVGTNTVSDLGVRANFIYDNHNLFRGAENFQLKFTGALEDVSHRFADKNLKSSLMKELGIESTFSLPKFLVPFKAHKFTRKYNPRTLLNASYNYQDRPGYARIIFNSSVSYKWKPNSYSTYQFFPLDFNYVWLPDTISDQNLIDNIIGTPLEASFIDHTIIATRLNYEYTNRIIEKEKDYIFFRANLESAGNIIHPIFQFTSLKSDTFLNVPYFRYLKGDFDFRIHNQITPANKLVYRIFAGVGYPLGNSDVLPLEKMYLGGGPNGVRAWSTGELGPGSYTDTSDAAMYGDIKLEANLEYRFKLFWVVEGALFVDAGNIWTVNSYENRSGTEFKLDRFYKEIAIGTGVGTRFDFSFLLIRVDFGFKMRDPSISSGSRWIDFNGMEYSLKDRFSIGFGIGYPF